MICPKCNHKITLYSHRGRPFCGNCQTIYAGLADQCCSSPVGHTWKDTVKEILQVSSVLLSIIAMYKIIEWLSK